MSRFAPSCKSFKRLNLSCAQAVVQADEALHSHDAKQANVRAKLAALGTARDAAPLKKAVDKAKKLGELEHAQREKSLALARDEKRAASDLKALGHWSGTLDDLDTPSFPSVETVESYRDIFNDAKAARNRLRDQLQSLDDEARQTAAQLELLRLGGDVPTEEALRDARAARAELWARFAASKTWDDALADAIEAAWRRADDLADRLRREAERVAQRAGLLADASRQNATRIDLDARILQAAAELDAVHARWSMLWPRVGVTDPGDPAEMLRWLDRRTKLLEKAAALADSRDELSRLDDQIAAQRRLLSDALTALGENAAGAGEGLANLIERAEEIVETTRHHTNERKKLIEKIETSDHERPMLEARRTSARDERDRWETRWAAVRLRLELPDDATPPVAAGMLDQIKILFDHLDRARALRRALDDAARDAERFTDDVRALASRVAADLVRPGDADFDAFAMSLELHRRLNAARLAESQRDSLDTQLRAITRTRFKVSATPSPRTSERCARSASKPVATRPTNSPPSKTARRVATGGRKIASISTGSSANSPARSRSTNFFTRPRTPIPTTSTRNSSTAPRR